MTDEGKPHEAATIEQLIQSARDSFAAQMRTAPATSPMAAFNNATSEIFALYQEACDALRQTADDNAHARSRLLASVASHIVDLGMQEDAMRAAHEREVGDLLLQLHAARRAAEENKAAAAELAEIRVMFERQSFPVDGGPVCRRCIRLAMARAAPGPIKRVEREAQVGEACSRCLATVELMPAALDGAAPTTRVAVACSRCLAAVEFGEACLRCFPIVEFKVY